MKRYRSAFYSIQTQVRVWEGDGCQNIFNILTSKKQKQKKPHNNNNKSKLKFVSSDIDFLFLTILDLWLGRNP